MFDRELAFFIAHQDELVAKFRGTTLVIRGEEVVSEHTVRRLKPTGRLRNDSRLGTFMLQPCESGRSAYSVTINSIH